MSKATKMAACQMIDEVRGIFGGSITHQFSQEELMEKFEAAAERVVARYAEQEPKL